MHRITAVATEPTSSPNGDSQVNEGCTACSPAVPLATLDRASTLSSTRTRNWKLTSTIWIRSLSTMPR